MTIRAWLACWAILPGMALAAPSIAPIEPPTRGSFDEQVIARGASLSAIGNCNTCHTAEGGKPFAGGRPFRTPYGTVYGTNITPEPETGIGRWSEAAFRRALHEGLDRDGNHLYPVFPYDHFTKLGDDDVAALYAYIMTREPVRARAPANSVGFPYSVREFIAVWKNLYFVPGRFVPDPRQGPQWNRGAYLVEGAGHCGACHTPRNALGAEQKDRAYAGGEAGGWHAPALNAESPSPVPWNAAALDAYLRTGLTDAHAIAAGPMAPVVDNLATVTDADTRAMAVYVAWLMGTPATGARNDPPHAQVPAGATTSGAAIYAGSCASCHDLGRTASSGGALELPLAIALALPVPSNLIHLTLQGVAPHEEKPGRFMPGFAGALTNEQVVALVQYLRTDVAGKPPWPAVDEEVAKVVAEINGR